MQFNILPWRVRSFSGLQQSAGLDILGIALLNEVEITWAKVERAVPPFTIGNFVGSQFKMHTGLSARTLGVEDTGVLQGAQHNQCAPAPRSPLNILLVGLC